MRIDSGTSSSLCPPHPHGTREEAVDAVQTGPVPGTTRCRSCLASRWGSGICPQRSWDVFFELDQTLVGVETCFCYPDRSRYCSRTFIPAFSAAAHACPSCSVFFLDLRVCPRSWVTGRGVQVGLAQPRLPPRQAPPPGRSQCPPACSHPLSPSPQAAISAFKNRHKAGVSFQKILFWTSSQHRAFSFSHSLELFLATPMLPGRADPRQNESQCQN